ncbi:MAG: hypothetical protein ACJ74Q_15775 [Pyrinomonadaceae bacterium]
MLLTLQPLAASAQQRRSRVAKGGEQTERGRRAGAERAGAAKPAAGEQAGVGNDKFQPVAVINRTVPDYLSGEASVTVNPKQPTVIRIGLAQNATSTVEWTATDLIYYHHEGNDKLVTVFDSPTKETDHFITLYPSLGFVAPSEEARKQGARTPSTTVTLQMTSGLVLVLEIVPVDDIHKNAHRVVINYSRDEVVAARKSAGLAVNLDGNDKGGPATNASSKRVAPNRGSAGGESDPASPKAESPVVADVDSSKADSSKKKGRKQENPSDAANKELVSAVKSPEKYFKVWSAAANGMSISLSPVKDVDDRSRVVVVAVKNVSTGPIRLVPGTPDLFIQITDERGTALRTDTVNRLHLESTSLGGRIPAGQVIYYAIVYETPILGSHEKLRVSVSQTEAADESVTAEMKPATN